ncbi:MAG: right-handed parallel beta-helix repeat-containing protein, partial [Pseudomonadota bacterium]
MATFIVTTLADENDAGAAVASPGGTGLSLREAVALANASDGEDVIVFASGLNDRITLTEGEIEITDAVTIEGGGLITISGDAAGDDVVADGVTDLSASSEAQLDDNTRIFNITDGDAATTLRGLTLTGGRTTDDSEGGGAVTSLADLTIENSVVAGNETTGDFSDGGGVETRGVLVVDNSTISGNRTAGLESEGGGVRAFGSMTITDSTVSDNSVSGYNAEGGGVFGSETVTIIASGILGNSTTGSNGRGGGVYSTGALTISESTVADNETTGPGGDGGGVFGLSTVTITDSTVNDNTTSFTFSEGGGVAAEGTITLTNSSVVGNSTTGDTSEGGGVFGAGAVELVNSTVTSNTTSGNGSDAGGVFASTISLTDSIVLGNASTGPNSPNEEIAGVPTFAGSNIVGQDAAAFDASVSGNVVNGDPTAVFSATQTVAPGVLGGVLADNGGAVETVALEDLGSGFEDVGAETVDDMRPPIIESAAVVDAVENLTDVLDVEAVDGVDEEGDGLTFSITGGADAALFSIDQTGALAFLEAPDFEDPSDANGDNVFNVDVTVTDSDGLTDSQSIAVVLRDEGPTNDEKDQLNGTAGRDLIDGLGGRDRISGFQE